MSGQDVMIMGAAVGASFLSLQFQLMVVYDDIQNQVGFTAEEVQERKIFYSGLLNRYRSQLEAIQAYF
jgi:hypothetical protein